jgi:hypothetical protein
MSFKDDVQKFVNLVEKRMDVVVQNSIGYLTEDIVLKTPVDSEVGPNGEFPVWYDPNSVGRARGSWVAGLNSPRSLSAIDPEGQATLRNAWAIYRFYRPRTHDTIYLANSAPYINILEFGGYNFREPIKSTASPGGFSWQAPEGMVRIHTKSWKQYVKDAVFEARSIKA